MYSVNGHLPSVAATYLIFSAIHSEKIKGLPTFSQTTPGGSPQFKTYTALFWTSTQENTNNAYAMNMYSEDVLTGGKTRSCDKVNYSLYDVFVSDISALPKFAIKSVHGCTLLMMRQRRCAAYFQKYS